jgi:hypothetical protein
LCLVVCVGQRRQGGLRRPTKEQGCPGEIQIGCDLRRPEDGRHKIDIETVHKEQRVVAAAATEVLSQVLQEVGVIVFSDVLN